MNTIEQDIFRKKTPDRDALLRFGFAEDGGGCFYSETFMGGDMRADIRVHPDGNVSASVIDADSQEEYVPVRIEAHTGAYVGAVREAFAALLQKIADACFVSRPFLFEQSNRIAGLIEAEYGEKPDCPFEKSTDIGVFRYPPNRKWYGLIMNIKRGLLTGESKEDSPIVEVLNLKADTGRIGELHRIPGIYPAYHMNRKYWISVLLDGSVPDELIMELIGQSRAFATDANSRKKRGKKGNLTKNKPQKSV